VLCLEVLLFVQSTIKKVTQIDLPMPDKGYFATFLA
jgi:hypothetical protein